MNKFEFVTAMQAPHVVPGTIMFLPPKDRICKGVYTDPKLLNGAYNHPVVIVSGPENELMKHDSLVEIAIMTSFNGTSLRKHLAAKGIEIRTEAIAARRAGYLRVVTASKPHTHDTLKLRNGKGMKRDCSYIGIGITYPIQLSALALYGSTKEAVDAYRLTSHATKKLAQAVIDAATMGPRARKATYLHDGKPGQNERKAKISELQEQRAKKPNKRLETVVRPASARQIQHKVARRRQQTTSGQNSK